MKQISVILLLIGFSCSTSSTKNKSLIISFTDVCIPIEGNQLSLYLIGCTYSVNQSTSFYGYNNLQHKFDVFDLKNAKYVRSIEMDEFGPEGISNIETFGVIKDDVLVIKESSRIVKLGDSISIFKLKPDSSYHLKNGFSLDEYTIISKIFDGIDIDSEQNLYFSLLSKDQKFPFVKINTNNKTLSLIPFENPKEYKVANYGYKMYPTIELGKDGLVINYNFSSKIYLYDESTEGIKSYNLKSSFTENETPPLSGEDLRDIPKRVDYHLNELNFYGVRYDKYRNLYLRVHQDKRESEVDKQNIYLTIISSDFRKMDEIKLPDKVKPYFEIGEEGIYFPVEPKDESHLCFKLLTFEDPNN
ncbi:MAG: hypothetical protein DRI71_10665 [Bacteroidetes bacterium]|nr:MAG: hypothetical protein DRI71_10665 [Bacteroidota bacterium]